VPELPDVEGFRRLLQSHVVGERITEVEVRDPGVVRGRSCDDLVRQLEGRRFCEPDRRGKWLLAGIGGPTLLFHFGMTGRLVWELRLADTLRFDRVLIYVAGGKLVFRDQRKLRGLWLADDEVGVREVIGEQGPDALGLTGARLEERLTSRRGALKSVLMDQRVLSGLGNMLSDEVLWRARIHPERSLDDLQAQERHELDRGLQRVLRASVKVGEIPRRATWLSSQRSQPDPHCPRCGNRLETSRINARTSYWCPSCQPAPPARRPLRTRSDSGDDQGVRESELDQR
jgi:formamidopyrimidine-DNA glycosylase